MGFMNGAHNKGIPADPIPATQAKPLAQQASQSDDGKKFDILKNNQAKIIEKMKGLIDEVKQLRAEVNELKAAAEVEEDPFADFSK